MKNLIAMTLLILVCPWLWATPTPQGFHWYTKHQSVKENEPPAEQAPSASTPYQSLLIMRQQTKEVLADALLNPNVKNAVRYMQVQQYWAKHNQRFVRAWAEALSLHPELDYSLNFPANNKAIEMKLSDRQAYDENVLSEAAKTSGLIFFYTGKSQRSKRFAQMLLPLIQRYHFSLISVTTDNSPIVGLPNQKNIPLAQVNSVLSLQKRYLPALYFVNLNTKTLAPVSFGFFSSDELKERLVDVKTHFNRYAYQGEGEQ